MNNDIEVPEAALQGAAIIDLADWLRGLDSIKAGLKPEYLAAFHDTRQYFSEMAKRFPDGVAPRDLPKAEARVLMLALVCAAAVSGHGLISQKAHPR